MKVDIQSDTSFFTSIEVERTTGEKFAGHLACEQGDWVLYSTATYAGGDRVRQWAPTRT